MKAQNRDSQKRTSYQKKENRERHKRRPEKR